ncbi:MAG: glycosyltransferase 87 family protein [Myxococcota bacterium]
MSEAHARSLARTATLLLAFACLLGIALPAGLGWDFANFYDTGRRVAAGQLADIFDASTPIAGVAPSTKLDFYGAPISAFLYAPLAALPPLAALVAFKLAGTAALWAALWLLYREGRARLAGDSAAVARHAARFAVAALLFQPLWTIYRVGGQTTPFAFLLLTLGLLAHLRGRVAWAALCFGVTVLIKPAFLIGFGFLGLLAGPRFIAASLLHGAWLGALSLALCGWPLHEAFLAKMLANAGGVARWTNNSSLWILPNEIAWRLAGPDAASVALPRWLVLPLQGGLLAAFAALARWTRRADLPQPARTHHHWMLALIFFLLFAQTAWEHYLAVLFLPVAFWLASWDVAPPSVRRVVALVVALSLAQNLVFVLAVAPGIERLGLPALLPALVVKAAPPLLVAWLLARHREDWAATYRRVRWQPM